MASNKEIRAIYPLSYLPLQGPNDKLVDGPFVIANGYKDCIVRLSYGSAVTFAYAVDEPAIEDNYVYVTDSIIDALDIDSMFAEITICPRRGDRHPSSYSSADSSRHEQ